MKSAAGAVALLATVLLLSACGQRGPLVLPDEPAARQAPATGNQEAPRR